MRDRIIIAPTMIPGKSMPRFHESIGGYDICYSSEYIHSLFRKTDKRKITTTIDHKGNPISCSIIASFLKGLDFEGQIRRALPFLSNDDVKILLNKFNSLPKRSWIQIQEFDSHEDREKIIASGKTGLSVELNHTINVNGKKIRIREEFERIDSPNDKLPFSLHIYGGSTWSWGRSEHGQAHLEAKKNGNSFDKIFIPYSKEWNSSSPKKKINLLTSEKGRVSRKERKKLVEWLDSDNNLMRCHESWNNNNKDNENRAMFIY